MNCSCAESSGLFYALTNAYWPLLCPPCRGWTILQNTVWAIFCLMLTFFFLFLLPHLVSVITPSFLVHLWHSRPATTIFEFLLLSKHRVSSTSHYYFQQPCENKNVHYYKMYLKNPVKIKYITRIIQTNKIRCGV